MSWLLRFIRESLSLFRLFESKFRSLQNLVRSLVCATCLFALVAVSSCGLLGSPESEVYSAVTAGNEQAVRKILERSSDVNVNWMPGAKSGPALVVASSFGEHEIAQLLIDHGANPNLGSTLSGSPLNSAAYHGDLKMCRILVSAGANVNLRSGRHGWTPLENARYKGHAAVVEFLKSAGGRQ